VSAFVDGVLRLVVTGVQSVRKLLWFVRRPNTYGAHAIALTPRGRIILVRLRYAPGWRVPGGGRRADEAPIDAALRELREEIGMTSHGEARLACDFEESIDFKRDTASLVVVRDVRYSPRWSWEVEQIREARVDSLPADISSTSALWIERLRPLL
jgi:8-oxo-dGTP pyrophosphatase MutT (NUDIX family)